MNYWGFFTAAGAVTSVLWLLRHHNGLGLSQNEFWASIWTLLVGAVAGAKIFFLILVSRLISSVGDFGDLRSL